MSLYTLIKAAISLNKSFPKTMCLYTLIKAAMSLYKAFTQIMCLYTAVSFYPGCYESLQGIPEESLLLLGCDEHCYAGKLVLAFMQVFY